jgi:hypothetical protein
VKLKSIALSIHQSIASHHVDHQRRPDLRPLASRMPLER